MLGQTFNDVVGVDVESKLNLKVERFRSKIGFPEVNKIKLSVSNLQSNFSGFGSKSSTGLEALFY